MPLPNHLASYASPIVREPTPLKLADLAFFITENAPKGRWRRRRFAHVGIIARSVDDYALNDVVQVLDMGSYVCHSDWRDALQCCRVDLSGTMTAMDDTVRAAVIDTALSYVAHPPSVLAGKLGYYFMGDPHPDSHSLFPKERSAYAFTCAWFAQYCYSESLPSDVGMLVQLDKMPQASDEEYQQLCSAFSKQRVQEQPLARLNPVYIMSAFDTDQFPFEPANWEEWQDHGRFIPEHMLV